MVCKEPVSRTSLPNRPLQRQERPEEEARTPSSSLPNRPLPRWPHLVPHLTDGASSHSSSSHPTTRTPAHLARCSPSFHSRTTTPPCTIGRVSVHRRPIPPSRNPPNTLHSCSLRLVSLYNTYAPALVPLPPGPSPPGTLVLHPSKLARATRIRSPTSAHTRGKLALTAAPPPPPPPPAVTAAPGCPPPPPPRGGGGGGGAAEGAPPFVLARVIIPSRAPPPLPPTRSLSIPYTLPSPASAPLPHPPRPAPARAPRTTPCAAPGAQG